MIIELDSLFPAAFDPVRPPENISPEENTTEFSRTRIAAEEDSSGTAKQKELLERIAENSLRQAEAAESLEQQFQSMRSDWLLYS